MPLFGQSKVRVAVLAGYPDLIVCAQAENSTSAMQEMDRNPCDVAVVDIALKNENGLDLIRRIKKRNQSVRVLVVSMHEEMVFAERTLSAGASGFLNKQAEFTRRAFL